MIDVWSTLTVRRQALRRWPNDHERSTLIITPSLGQDPDSPKFGAHRSFDNFTSYPKNPNNHNNHHNHNKHNNSKAILSCCNQNKCSQDEF